MCQRKKLFVIEGKEEFCFENERGLKEFKLMGALLV
jgi:hypothetical protein